MLSCGLCVKDLSAIIKRNAQHGITAKRSIFVRMAEQKKNRLFWQRPFAVSMLLEMWNKNHCISVFKSPDHSSGWRFNTVTVITGVPPKALFIDRLLKSAQQDHPNTHNTLLYSIIYFHLGFWSCPKQFWIEYARNFVYDVGCPVRRSMYAEPKGYS